MHARRTSSQSGAVDRRILVGVGGALALVAVVLVARPRRAPPPVVARVGRLTPPPPPPPEDVPAAPPAPREDDFHIAEPSLPTRSEQPRRPAPPPRDVPPVIPASSGDYGVDVATLVRPALPGLQRCVAALDPAHPRAAEVWITINVRGRVSAAHLATDAGAATDACLLAALRGVAFAVPGSESATFGIPIPALAP